MRILKSLTLVGATIVLVLAAQAIAAGPTTVSSTYTVGSLTVPGVDTGLVLRTGQSVTVTATGSVCPHDLAFCVGPDGDPSIDTTHSEYGGWVLPGAPAYGLVGRVGDGPWVQVGSGPTTLSGSGDLVFAVNDEYGAFGDNSGSFTVTISSSSGCYPGNGYGDTNHDHSGPPGRDNSDCWPGYGYGDTNHDHSGPPGRAGQGSSGAGANGNGKHTR